MDTRNFASDILDFIHVSRDRLTSAFMTVDTDHAYIHNGIMFTNCIKRTFTGGATAKISMRTPSNKYIHFRPSTICTSSEDFSVDFYEGNSNDTAGGTLTSYNRNRVSSLTSQMTIKESASISSSGNIVERFYVGGSSGAGGQSGGSEAREQNEIILKQDYNYSFVLTNGTASNTVLFKLFWYEED